MQQRRIHKSRVLRFPGKRLPYEILRTNGGYNDSIVQAMFNAFAQYNGAIGASSAMLQDYSVFVYKLKGLRNTLEGAGAVTSGVVDKQKSPTDKLLTRFKAIQMGMSIIKGLMLDADTEDASFMQRNYGGVTDIVNQLQDAMVAASDMPMARLFGSGRTGAFSESGKSDRYEWASLVSSYQAVQWQAHVETITRYICLAKDSKMRGTVPEFEFKWHSILELTDAERAELRYKNAQADALYLAREVVTPEEVRESRFGGGDYGGEIVLSKTPQRTDDNLAQLRQDVADGLVPKSVYWQAIGLDAEQVLEMEKRERDRQISKPSGRFW
jgi:phage-related protein (TIGR01555 family)